MVRHEEVGCQRLARIDAVAVEVGDTFAGQKRVVDQKMAGKTFRRLGKNLFGRRRLPYRSDEVRRATAATNSSARARNRFNSGDVLDRL